ncbi:MAG: CDP-diacylglycerol--glycerol-3-phosphate 3-phosphatidyltransferase [Deltaproteobacteria bacterium]|nr:CDP-diacylglycerol--glycerol-3-phosphate 3-phosphatidyltransferase [Deltaproteobacteria bacterium]
MTVPNILTISRIVLVPVLVVLLSMIDPQKGAEDNFNIGMWTMWIFIIGGITDLVDGYCARKLGMVSKLGKFIDPMADKLICMAVMVMLIPLGRIDAWVVVVLLFRDIFITGIRAVAASEGIVIAAAEWGKRKTAWLNVALSAMILYYPLFKGTVIELNVFFIANVCLLVGTVYSLASGLMYTFRFFKEVITR